MTIKIKDPETQPAVVFDKLKIRKFEFAHIGPGVFTMDMLGTPYGLDGEGNVVLSRTRASARSNDLKADLIVALIEANQATDPTDAKSKLAAARTKMQSQLSAESIDFFDMYAAFEVFQGQLFDLLTNMIFDKVE